MLIMMPFFVMMLGLLGCSDKQIAYVKDPQQWQERYATDAVGCDSRVITGQAAATENWSQEMKDDFVRCMHGKGWSYVREKGTPTRY
jgi:hypothetical protein